jgi:hypothetical protein
MTDRDEGTKIHTHFVATNPASLLPLQQALGYDLAQSLFVQSRNLVLEGLTDYWYLASVAALLREAGTVEFNETISLLRHRGRRSRHPRCKGGETSSLMPQNLYRVTPEDGGGMAKDARLMSWLPR